MPTNTLQELYQYILVTVFAFMRDLEDDSRYSGQQAWSAKILHTADTTWVAAMKHIHDKVYKSVNDSSNNCSQRSTLDQPKKVQVVSETEAVAEPMQNRAALPTPSSHTATP
ncbi:hypothetical protein MRX96_054142 [Rhipicephalus microplus]